MSHTLYNPKATAPAVYIPAWLSQVPSKLLPPSCKMIYGRLAQWASSEGKAHRSAPQLSQELGIPVRTVENCINILKNKSLLGSCQHEDGGVNHYEFYDHPWMHEPINKNLCYKSDNFTPPAKIAVPPAKIAVPPAKIAVHKIKEIKGNKKKSVGKVETDVSSTHTNVSSLKKEKAEQIALQDEAVLKLFREKFSGYSVTIEELFAACQEHYEQKNLWATKDKFMKWVKSEKIENYYKTGSNVAKLPEYENKIPTQEDFDNYKHCVQGYDWVAVWLQKQKKS
jgi:hypothetical protein